MSFVPEYSREQVVQLRATGKLTRFQIYALEHQHPLCLFTHVFGIPLVLFAAIWPIVAWFAWGEIAWEVWTSCMLVGWAFQLVGHRIEGNKPAFFKDPLQLLVGPIYMFVLKPLRFVSGKKGLGLDAALLQETA